MQLFRKTSIKQKQTVIVVLTSGAALLIACVAFSSYEVMTFRKAMEQNLSTFAQIIGDNSSAALDFGDAKAARETLSALRADPNIVGGCVYDAKGEVFASYDQPGDGVYFTPPPFRPERAYFNNDSLEIYRPIMRDGERIGTVCVVSRLTELHARLERYALISIGVFFASALAALAVSSQLQKLISVPILSLVTTARTVTTEKNYSVRVPKQSEDELGVLIDAFNEMLNQIQERDSTLQKNHAELEKRVVERTQQVENSLSLIHATLESTTDGIIVVDGNRKITSSNQRFFDLWGLSSKAEYANNADNVRALLLRQLKDPEAYISKIETLYSDLTIESFDQLELKDGRVIERYSKPQVIGEKSVGRVWSFRDVTKQREATKALEENRQMLDGVLTNTIDGVVAYEAIRSGLGELVDFRILLVNPAAEQLLGQPAGELVGRGLLETSLDIVLDGLFEPFVRIIETGETLDFEYSAVRSGVMCWFRVAGVKLGDGLVMSYSDITQRKMADEQLERLRHEHRDVLNSVGEGVHWLDTEGLIKFENPAAARMLGYNASELVGKPAHMIMHHSRADGTPYPVTECPIYATLKDQTLRRVKDEVFWRKDGTSFPVEYTSTPINDENGNFAGVVVLFTDITERKQSEIALAYERDLLRALLDSSPDLIYFKDEQSRFLKASQSVAKNFDLNSTDAVVGKTDFAFYAPKHARTAFDDERKIIRTGLPLVDKVEKETLQSGRENWVLTSKMPFRNKEGEIIGTFGISKDITVIKETELKLEHMHRQLLETSRQAGMAEVATSVLHNVGNVLNSINVSSTLVSERVKKSKIVNLPKLVTMFGEHANDLGSFLTNDPKGRQVPGYLAQLAEHLLREQTAVVKELGLLHQNIEHVKDIVTMQQSYAKISGVVEVVNAVDLVEDTLRMNIGALQRHGVTLVRKFEDVPPIEVEKHKVLQILVNIVRNAKYACDESGQEEKIITVRIAKHNDRLQISVIDNGIGIPAENLTRIFSHGFTTRKDGHGFGLHSAVLAAMEMGGSLTVHSDGPGKGAAFTLDLPFKPKPT